MAGVFAIKMMTLVVSLSSISAFAKALNIPANFQDNPANWSVVVVGGVLNADDANPQFVQDVDVVAAGSNGPWRTVQPIPSPNQYIASTAVDFGLIYVLAANPASQVMTLLTYDIGSNTWNTLQQTLSNLPYVSNVKSGYTMVAQSNTLHILGRMTNMSYAVDLHSNSFTRITDLPASATTGCVVVADVNSKLFVMAGNGMSLLISADNGQSWSLAPNGRNAVQFIDACVAVDDQIIVVGRNGSDQATSEVYTISTKSWAAQSPLLTSARSEATAVREQPSSSKVLVCGGEISQHQFVATCEQIDLSLPAVNQTWTATQLQLNNQNTNFGMFYVVPISQTTTAATTTPSSNVTTPNTNASPSPLQSTSQWLLGFAVLSSVILLLGK